MVPGSCAADHPEEAARSVVSYSPALDYDTARAHWRESLKAIQTPFVKQQGYGHATESRLQRTIALVHEAFKLKKPLVPGDIYVDGFVPR